jgi:hypothetical protein
MKKVSVVLMCVMMIVLSFQEGFAQKEKYHSIFIYNFSKYVKWPDNVNSGKFIIGVMGTSTIQNELKEMAAAKQVNGMPIEVKQCNSVADIKGCHILYISATESGKLDQVVNQTQAQSVLIVTDKPGLAKQGSAINFVEVEGKIKFELNQGNAESHGLKVSGSLTSLAIMV